MKLKLSKLIDCLRACRNTSLIQIRMHSHDQPIAIGRDVQKIRLVAEVAGEIELRLGVLIVEPLSHFRYSALDRLEIPSTRASLEH